MSDDFFPKKGELRNAVVEVMRTIGGVVKTADINKEVIRLLKLPKEVVYMENPGGDGTLLDYRLRWARTELKKEGIIINVNRGFWKIKDWQILIKRKN